MHRSSFSSGQVAVALVKALMLRLDLKRGPVVTDGWLKAIGISRDALEDETQLMTVGALSLSLSEFADIEGRAAIVDVWPQLIATENLGFWVRVLRGTTGPAQAFSRLDASESEYGRTTRWQTLEVRRGYWRGRVHVLHDPSLEQSGLLALLRAAQLRAVTALFGLGPGVVTATASLVSEASMLSQEYEVRWKRARLPEFAAMGGLLGAALGGSSSLLHAPQGVAVGASLTTAAVCAAFGVTFAREASRRADLTAQQLRVLALERSLVLKETRDRVVSTRIDGSIIAGKYRVHARMGSGASGVIYEARRISDDFAVAVKLLRAANAHDAVASDRLRRESEALGLSWHTNVVEMIDHGHLADGTSFLVMELLRGETLAHRLRSQGRIGEHEAFAYALQISDALVAVHAAGVLHRDLKPSNIFVAKQPDGSERIKLIDFGIARVEWEETRITGMGAPVGTPGYMSPEQEAGGEVDARSDLFVLGATMFECLAGEPPPPTPSGLFLSSGTPADGVPVGIARKIPPHWQAIIEGAMAPDPKHRFPDARALSAALREAAERARVHANLPA